MKITKYPDGTSYVELTNEIGDIGEILPPFKVNTYEDLHHLEQFIDAYTNKFYLTPTITIPNLIDAQADRRFADNQSNGLKIVLKRLNYLQANFKIFHPHNPEVVEAMMDNAEIIDNSEFIMQVIYDGGNGIAGDLGFTNKELTDNLILFSADAGGYKPLMKLADKLNWQGETCSASKSRSYVDSKSKITQIVPLRDFEGKDILIVDDISVYGGTFKGLSKLLKEHNIGKLYLAVSHMTVQNLGEDPVTDYFDRVFTTNSKFDSYFYKDKFDFTRYPENLEIIKLF